MADRFLCVPKIIFFSLVFLVRLPRNPKGAVSEGLRGRRGKKDNAKKGKSKRQKRRPVCPRYRFFSSNLGEKPQNILETPSQNRPQLQFLDKGGRKIVKGLLLLAGGKITFLPYTARHEREKHQETATLLK